MTIVTGLLIIVILFLAMYEIAALVHETGHIAAALALGYPAMLGFHKLGIGVRWGYTRPATRRARIIVSLAGPAASLLFAALFAAAGWNSLAIMSAALGAINAIPFGHSDGAHAWKAAWRS